MGYEMAQTKKLIVFFCLILTVSVFSAAATDAAAANLYVSTNGNDGNPGTLNSPVATVKHAFDLASPGDNIILRGGTYTFSRFLWVDKDNLTFSSYTDEKAVITGSTTDETNLASLFIIYAHNITLKDLEIQGGSYYAVKLEEATNAVITNCRIYNSGRDCVKTFNCDNLLIEKCEIGPSGVRDSSNAEGIDSIGSIGITIRDCYIHDTATTGIYLKGGATNGVIERNRIEHTGHSGILLGQDTDEEFMRNGTPYECLNSVARNNIIIATKGAGLGTYSGKNISFENNTLYDVAQSYNGGFYVTMNGREVPAEQVRFKNNIVVVLSSRPMAFVMNLLDPLVSDSNVWFRPTGGTYKFWQETPSAGHYWENFNDWQLGMGADHNSMTTDPMLDAEEMYLPASDSPVIDHGESLTGVLNDYLSVPRPQGNAFDIGAREMPSENPPGNQPPAVSVSATPTSGAAPLAVAFASNASDPDGQVVGYNWDFGDGQSSSQASPSHVYQVAGTFTAKLTVTDNGGAMASATVQITATGAGNQSPVVTITASRTSGVAPLRVSFTVFANDPDGQVVGYSWDFGDGQTSAIASPEHNYQTPGTYLARLTVTDNGGATANAQTTITVDAGEPVEPVVHILSPNTRIKVSSGQTLTIKWTVTGTGLYRQDIQYTVDGGSRWTDIVNGLSGMTTSYNWVVPNSPSKKVRVRVIAYGDSRYTGQDECDENFIIKAVKAKLKKKKNKNK